MAVVLTAMNRFLNEDDGLQMAFLDGVCLCLCRRRCRCLSARMYVRACR